MSKRKPRRSAPVAGVADYAGALVEFMDVPLTDASPVVWTINEYDRPTPVHYDVHVGVELGIVLSGRSRRLYADYEFETRPGDVWFAGLWEPHGMQVLARDTRHLVFGLLPAFLGVPDHATGCDWMQLFRLPPHERPRASSVSQRRAVLGFAQRMTEIMRSNDRHRLARLRILIQEFLLHFMSSDHLLRATPRSASAGSSPVSLLPALRLIDRHPDRKLTLSDGAAAASMSRSQFAAQFHLQTGITFARYVARRRLGGVVGDLRETDDKLQTIATRWGFADASHLVRVFKQHTGATPDAYRRDRSAASPTVARMPKPVFTD